VKCECLNFSARFKDHKWIRWCCLTNIRRNLWKGLNISVRA